ncbi:MAG: ABC transporter permease, partial [Bryobacteraceae bacterium]|nr:ABC transporter permease [Bryobacteraceae bacterium]
MSIGTLLAKLIAVFQKPKLDRELDEELEAHLQLCTEENEKRGMSPGEARRAAMISLGGVEPAKELHRDSRGLPFLEVLLQDLRFSLRTLKRDASFTVFAILIIGLGTGASSTVFSLFNTVLLRPLPFHQSQELLWIANGGESGLSGQTTQVGHLVDLKERNHSFADIGAYFAFYEAGDIKLSGTGEPERLTGVPVTENFFSVLGVKPLSGRLFTPEECRWQGPAAILLSHQFWVRRFASDFSVVGRTLILDDRPAVVAGVLPASFDFAASFAPGQRIDIFRPFPLAFQTNRQGNTLAIIARLKPGVSFGDAGTEIRVFAERIAKERTDRNDFRPVVTTLQDHVSGSFRAPIVLLASAVGVLMLIVCANLSNLLLARTLARQKEIAIRAALGAGRSRLISQVLTESFVLSSGGALLGLILALAGTFLLSRTNAFSIPLIDHLQVDARVLGFSLATAILTGLLFGLTPAFHVSTLAPNRALKEGSRGSTGSKGRETLRSLMVVAEIAFACVLLIGAGLLTRSLLHVMQTDPGFRPETAVTMRIDPSANYATQVKRNAYFNEVLQRVASAPGVTAAGITDSLPLGSNRSWGAGAKGVVYPRGQYPNAFVRIVSDGYLDAMGIRIRTGRDLTPTDSLTAGRTILINETLARTLWPGDNPIGKVVDLDGGREVVGVVHDVRHLALEKESGSEMYLPIRQTDDYSSVDLVVRGTQSSADLAAAVRTVLSSIDPGLPVREYRTIQELVDRSVSPRRFFVFLLVAFAGFALVLASLGIYGVVSYGV